MSLKLRFWKRWPPSAPNQGAQWSLSRTQKKRSRTLSRLLHTDTNFQRSPVLCHESHKKTPISMKMMNRNDLKNHNNLKNLEWQFSKSLEFFICILCWNIFFSRREEVLPKCFWLIFGPCAKFAFSCFLFCVIPGQFDAFPICNKILRHGMLRHQFPLSGHFCCSAYFSLVPSKFLSSISVSNFCC